MSYNKLQWKSFGKLQIGGQQNEHVAQRAAERRIALGEAGVAAADDQFASPSIAHQRIDHRLKIPSEKRKWEKRVLAKNF